jgi:hypothetical protein
MTLNTVAGLKTSKPTGLQDIDPTGQPSSTGRDQEVEVRPTVPANYIDYSLSSLLRAKVAAGF